MLKKLSLSFVLLSSLAAITACQDSEPMSVYRPAPVMRAEVWQPKIDMPSSVVVCRSKQCAPAKLSMSKEFIYNSLLHLLDNNTQNKALICAADPSSHVCTETFLTLPITVGVTPANMYIDAVRIDDISASLGNKSLTLLLNYAVTYNGQTPTCKPAQSLVYVKNASNIIMEDAGYQCKMTTIGNTTIKTLFAIDYIDLDYGYIGGYYSIGLSGPAYGGGSGYMLLRLPNDAYPLAPSLMMPVEESTPAITADPAQAIVNETTEINVPTVTTTTETKTEQVTVTQPENVRYIPCANKRNCSPAADKKMIIKDQPLPNETPKTISEQLYKGKTYNGVQVFPLAPKKKSKPVEPVETPKNSADEEEIIETSDGDLSEPEVITESVEEESK